MHAACISQYQMEAANNPPSSAQIMYFKAVLSWKEHHLVVPSLVAHILTLYPILTWNTVLDDVSSSHLCQFDDVTALGHPSQIIPSYDTTWWMGHIAILNEPWQWGQIMRSCVAHYQHWMETGVEDDDLVLPEVNDSLGPSVMGLKLIQACLVALMEEQDEGIHEKMAEVKMYTDMLQRLKRGRGV
ncbi:hypothetical protein BDR07DRAFT_1380757 [Suillus spraguei]|nr:hypothetical protein BDR07DRAFT_1380757 [Suillus spraguei]